MKQQFKKNAKIFIYYHLSTHSPSSNCISPELYWETNFYWEFAELYSFFVAFRYKELSPSTLSFSR